MLQKKFYIPIGVLLVAVVALGIFALRWDTSKEPIKVYKTVTPAERPATVATLEVTEPATVEHLHADGDTSHTESLAPVETSQSSTTRKSLSEEEIAEFHREMTRKVELKRARDAERDRLLLPILEKGGLLNSEYQDVLTITADKYREFSQAEREAFYQRCLEVDAIIANIKEQYVSLPQWIKDKLDERHPDAKSIIDAPPISPIYGELAALGRDSTD